MSFRGRIFPGSQAYPPDAGLFMTKSFSGGTYTTTQKRALGYLVNGLSELGIGAPGSNWFIYPFIGGTAEKHSLNLFYPGIDAYNLTFVGSPTHDSTGPYFNGTTQYAIAPSLAIYPLSPNLTTANISYGFCTSSMGGSTYVPIGYFFNNILQTKTYSTAGSYTFNPNIEAPGITSYIITAWGAGGAGGGSDGTTSNFPAGGAPGGGYATRNVTLTKAQGATSMTIVVGSGGTANSGASGGTGTNSIVTHPNFTGISAVGGLGGRVNTAAAGALTAALTSSSGTTVRTGGSGAAGGAAAGRGGGGGGSTPSTGSAGVAGATPTTSSGGAGGVRVGGFNGGAGGVGTLGGAGFAGISGVNGGGGGGGAGSTNAGNNRAGGAGGGGTVTIQWTPSVFKRNSLSIFVGGTTVLLDCAVGSDASSRFRYEQSSETPINGVYCGSRRGNTGTAADMGLKTPNGFGSAINGPIVMSTTSFDPSPNWYIGALNAQNGTGNNAGNFYEGYLTFAFIGPAMSDGQLTAMNTLITTYNSILGR